MKPEDKASQSLLDNDLVPRSWVRARVRTRGTRSCCLGALWEPAFPGHESFEMITLETHLRVEMSGCGTEAR